MIHWIPFVRHENCKQTKKGKKSLESEQTCIDVCIYVGKKYMCCSKYMVSCMIYLCHMIYLFGIFIYIVFTHDVLLSFLRGGHDIANFFNVL